VPMDRERWREDVRLGPRDQRPGDQPRWLTSGTSISTSVHGSDHVDRVKTEDVQVERGSEDLVTGRSRTVVTHVKQRGTHM
jgi:hypothetical protein